MSGYPLTLEEIVSWFRSKESAFVNLGITLAEMRECQKHKPSAAADFDAAQAIGRISVWVTGEIDFEVLRIADGAYVSFHHEKVSSLKDPALEKAYDDFLWNMAHPDQPEK